MASWPDFLIGLGVGVVGTLLVVTIAPFFRAFRALSEAAAAFRRLRPTLQHMAAAARADALSLEDSAAHPDLARAKAELADELDRLVAALDSGKANTQRG